MTNRLAALAGMALCALLAWSGAGNAQTISFADAMTVLAQDCGADVKKHCAGLNLGNGEIQSCLESKQAQVSPQCIATLASVTASISTRLAAQASVFKVCAANAAQHCKGVKGEARILQCLVKTERINSAKCNQAITDSGWR